jgi:hypothetical protein
MNERSDLSSIETVRCLSCSALYPKPLGGGIVRANPGCPECGYSGWVLATGVKPDEPRRFAEDLPRRRFA